MRTTLDIDDDVLAAAKELSKLQQISTGQMVSRLLRQALAGRDATTKTDNTAVGGFRPFASRGLVVTNEQVNLLREGEGL